MKANLFTTTKTADWLPAEDAKIGDVIVERGLVFKIKNLYRDNDELVVMGGPKTIRRYEPNDIISIWKNAGLITNVRVVTAADYMGMFAKILASPEIAAYVGKTEGQSIPSLQVAREAIADEVQWCSRVLKKSDRIVWWLKWYRLGIIQHYMPQYLAKEILKVPGASRDRVDIDPVIITRFDNGPWRALHQRADHFFATPCPQIQEWHPKEESIHQAISVLAGIEKAWQDSRKRVITPQDGDTELIKFADGWAWWLLDRSYCSDESRAMGHCGNGASQDDTERILSLRQPIGNGEWEPHCTFIIDSDGYIGEMKGRNNDKPVKKYHKYIIDLLKNDMVKGLKGGGYMPSHNFSIMDLTEEEREGIYAVKPELMPLADYYRKFGADDSFVANVLAKFKADNSNSEVAWDAAKQKFIMETWNSVGELVDSYGNDTAKWAAGILHGGEYMEVETGMSRDEDAESMLEELPQPTINKVGLLLQHQYADQLADFLESEGRDDEDDEFDPADEDDVYKLAVFVDDDELLDALSQAKQTGQQYGTEAEVSKAFTDAVEEAGFTALDEGNWWDGKWAEMMSPGQVAAIIDGGETLDEYHENEEIKIEMSQPYYGFNDYDEEAALDAFDENYDYDKKFIAAFGEDALKEFIAKLPLKERNAEEWKSLSYKVHTDVINRLPPTERGIWQERIKAFKRGNQGLLMDAVREIMPDAFADSAQGPDPDAPKSDPNEFFDNSDATKTAAIDYMSMFSGVLKAHPSRKSGVEEQVAWAKRVLKKSDRVIWWLRWLRMSLLYEFYIVDSNELPALNKDQAAYIAKSGQELTPLHLHQLNQYRDRLSHLFSLPCPALQETHPEYKTPRDYVNELDDIELEWEDEMAIKNAKVAPQEGDQEIITMPNGWAWWHLSRGVCLEEARAMGHCGNEADGNSDDTILSFREPVKHGDKTLWRPHLTFILTHNLLGEMKGRNNTKPDPKFFPAIEQLLLWDGVEGLEGGGYKPENNFSMEDLPIPAREKLYAHKPNLMPLSEMFRRYGVSDMIGERIAAQWEPDGEQVVWDSEQQVFSIPDRQKSIRFVAEGVGDYEISALTHFITNMREDGRRTRSTKDDVQDHWLGRITPLPWQEMLPHLGRGEINGIGEFLLDCYAEDITEWEKEKGTPFNEGDVAQTKDLIEYLHDQELQTWLADASRWGYAIGSIPNLQKEILEALAESYYVPADPDKMWSGYWHPTFTVPEAVKAMTKGRNVLEALMDKHKVTPKAKITDEIEFTTFDDQAARDDFYNSFDGAFNDMRTQRRRREQNAKARQPKVAAYNQDAWQTDEREYELGEHGRFDPDETPEVSQARHRRGQEWDQATMAALSTGKLTPEQAKERKIHTSPRLEEFKPLPSPLFHVTTAASKVRSEGLQSRWELAMQGGLGLGGGDDKSISFTTKIETAHAIYDALLLAREASSGELTVEEMVTRAKAGTGAKRPFMKDFEEGIQAIIGGKDPLEKVLRNVRVEMSMMAKPPKEGEGWKPTADSHHWTGGDGIERYLTWERPLDAKEADDARWSVFKAFLYGREHGGGSENPLFSMTDTTALAKVNPAEIAILEYRPVPGAMGTRCGGLEEWRTYSGKAVQFVKVVPVSKTAKVKTASKPGWVMADLPEDSPAARAVEAIRATISDDDLMGHGKDVGVNHITLRYGLLGTDADAIADYLSGLEPFQVELGTTIAFDATPNSDNASPIVFPCSKGMLHEINKKLGSIGEWKAEDFDYTPHVTVAYVKPETAEKYVGKRTRMSQTFTVNHIVIETRFGGEKKVIEIELDTPLTKTAGASAMPTKTLPKLYHVGDMDITKKNSESQEGDGLSVSTHPDAWEEINPGTGGPHWLLTKAGNRFLDYHKLTKSQKKTIADWGVEQGLAVYGSVYRLSYDNEGTEAYMDFDSLAEAEAEKDEYADGVIEVMSGYPIGTMGLFNRMGHRPAPVMTRDFLAICYAEEVLHLDGVWWADRLSPESLSAPRGTIFNAMLPSWTKKQISLPNEYGIQIKTGAKDETLFDSWIGVDLDGTWAESLDDYSDPTKIGAPIPEMTEKIRLAFKAGYVVKVFTARVAEKETREKVTEAIQDWTEHVVGVRLGVTHEKNPGLLEYWDDKARRVIENTGKFAYGKPSNSLLLGRAVRRFCRSDESLAILDQTTANGGGWMEGGCWILAAAIAKGFSGEVYCLMSRGNTIDEGNITEQARVQHFVAKVGHLYVDADGASMKNTLLRRWKMLEHLHDPYLEPFQGQPTNEIPQPSHSDEIIAGIQALLYTGKRAAAAQPLIQFSVMAKAWQQMGAPIKNWQHGAEHIRLIDAVNERQAKKLALEDLNGTYSAFGVVFKVVSCWPNEPPPDRPQGKQAAWTAEGRRGELGMRVDNPAAYPDAGEAEKSWLANHPRTITAWYESVMVPTAELVKLPGARNEHMGPDEALVNRLTESIREQGFRPADRPLVVVEADGQPKIYEGNHRVRAALAAGLAEIPVLVRYWGGAEMIPGVWDPSTFSAVKTAAYLGPNPAQLATLKDIESRTGDFNFLDWLKEYIDDDALYAEALADESSRLDYLNDWLREEGITVEENGCITFWKLTPEQRELIGDLPVIVYHHTSSNVLAKIRKEGLRGDVKRKANPHQNSGSGVYVTTELSGPAVEGYRRNSHDRHRTKKDDGRDVAIPIKTTLGELEPDPDDEDITSGAVQFVLPYVAPEDIIWDDLPGVKTAAAIPLVKIQKLLAELRAEDGPGQCYTMSEILENKFGYRRAAGFFLPDPAKTDHQHHGDHGWNETKDGTLVDATHDQFGPPDINVLAPGATGREHYHEYCGDYDCPICTCEICNESFAEEARKAKGKQAALATGPLYHVTFTRLVPKIRKDGIQPGKPANWKQRGNGKDYGKGEVNAFNNRLDALRWAGSMDWEFNQKTGSGKISIVEFKPGDAHWVPDNESDPLTRVSYKGDWIKSTTPVAPDQIVGTEVLTPELIRSTIAALNKVGSFGLPADLQAIQDSYSARGVAIWLNHYQKDGEPYLELSRVEVPKDTRKQGIGTAFMKDLTAWADDHGETIFLTPDDSIGATSVGRLKTFYGRFGFVRNQGRNKDFRSQDAMIRKPREAAKKVAAELDKVLVIVHPGSACGSANDHYRSTSIANAEREGLEREWSNWQGGVIVLDGDFSDELPDYPDLNAALLGAVDRAKAAGKVSIRQRAQDPAQVKVIKQILSTLELPQETTYFVCTGAWAYSATKGCVPSVSKAIRSLGYRVEVSDSALTGSWMGEDSGWG